MGMTLTADFNSTSNSKLLSRHMSGVSNMRIDMLSDHGIRSRMGSLCQGPGATRHNSVMPSPTAGCTCSHCAVMAKLDDPKSHGSGLHPSSLTLGSATCFNPDEEYYMLQVSNAQLALDLFRLRKQTEQATHLHQALMHEKADAMSVSEGDAADGSMDGTHIDSSMNTMGATMLEFTHRSFEVHPPDGVDDLQVLVNEGVRADSVQLSCASNREMGGKPMPSLPGEVDVAEPTFLSTGSAGGSASDLRVKSERTSTLVGPTLPSVTGPSHPLQRCDPIEGYGEKTESPQSPKAKKYSRQEQAQNPLDSPGDRPTFPGQQEKGSSGSSNSLD